MTHTLLLEARDHVLAYLEWSALYLLVTVAVILMTYILRIIGKSTLDDFTDFPPPQVAPRDEVRDRQHLTPVHIPAWLEEEIARKDLEKEVLRWEEFQERHGQTMREEVKQPSAPSIITQEHLDGGGIRDENWDFNPPALDWDGTPLDEGEWVVRKPKPRRWNPRYRRTGRSLRSTSPTEVWGQREGSKRWFT